jgi:hypothetical protein
MKNKVMGKALSWVLSAAMALTMSGAIPAMTYSGVVSMVADTALGTGKTATLPSTLASTILNTTESSAVVATSVTGTAVNASGATPTAAATATYYLQDVDGVSATGFYMPSFKEFVAAWSTDPTSTIGSATSR